MKTLENEESPVQAVPTKSKVTLGTKIAYALGGSTNLVGTNTVKTLAVPYFQMTLFVDPALLGLAMAVPRIWDAITDPFMGHLSDQTKSRFGRRKPYIVLGAILAALAYIAIWHVPLSWGPHAMVYWYLGCSLVFFTFFTMWQVPYTALGYEVTPDYDERTQIMGANTLAGQITNIGAPWIFPIASGGFLAAYTNFSSTTDGMHFMAILVGLTLIAGVGIVPGLFVKERYAGLADGISTKKKPKHNMLRTFKLVFKNHNMRLLLGIQLTGAISSIFASGLDYYVIVYYMFDGDVAVGSTWKAILSSGFAICGFLSVPLLVIASKKFDKRPTLVAVYVLSLAGALLSWITFNPVHHWFIVISPILVTHVYTATLIKQSMVADICDEEELKTGERHEGAFAALFQWVHKMSMSLSFLAAGIVLNTVGFDSELGGEQPEGTMTSIRLVLLVVPAAASILSLVLLSKYNLNRKKMTKIRQELEARRGVC